MTLNSKSTSAQIAQHIYAPDASSVGVHPDGAAVLPLRRPARDTELRLSMLRDIINDFLDVNSPKTFRRVLIRVIQDREDKFDANEVDELSNQIGRLAHKKGQEK